MRFRIKFTWIIYFVLLEAEESLGRIRFENAEAKYTEIRTTEGLPINTTLANLTATSDQPNTVITYSIKSTNNIADKYIRINAKTGRLSNIVVLDSEESMLLKFHAEAHAGTEKASVSKVLHVIGINDNHPLLPNTTDIYVNENATYGNGDVIGRVSASDADRTDSVEYGITNTENIPFGIGRYSGDIILKSSLDYERINTYTLNVSATDGKHTSYGTLIIHVNDMDDQGARFEQTLYYASLDEGTYTNKMIEVAIHAYDLDLGRNESVRYTLHQGKIGPLDVRINATTGQLYVNGSVDYEHGNNEFVIQIEALSTNFPAAQTIILLRINDVNDNKPEFEHYGYHGNVAENSLVGTPVLRVVAHDKDQGNNAVFKYSIYGNQSLPFTVTTDGEIQVNGSLDREKKSSYTFQVVAMETLTKERYSNRTDVTITVDDINDNTPQFLIGSLHVKVKENLSPPIVVANLTSFDNDTGPNGERRYSIQADPSGIFYIDDVTGVLMANRTLDREEQDKYEFLLVVHDLAPLPLRRQSTIEAIIDVLDENDHTPTFEKPRYEVDVSEAVSVNTLVTTIKAVDEDIGNNSIVKYSIVDGNLDNKFSIDSKSGEVRTHHILDRETRGNFTLIISAQDGGNKIGTCELFISILDINDNQPIFTRPNYTFSVLENQNQDTLVGTVKATDKDLRTNGHVTYSIVTSSDRFTIDSQTGSISTLKRLDREDKDAYTLLVMASDSGTPTKLYSTCEVFVTVLDVDDNKPVFLEFITQGRPKTILFRHTMTIGKTIYTFTAEDKDTGSNAVVKYSMRYISHAKPDFLDFNTSTGEVKINSTLPNHPITVIMLVTAYTPSNPSSSTHITHEFSFINGGSYSYSATIMGTVLENKPPGTQVNLDQVIPTSPTGTVGDMFCADSCPFEIRNNNLIYTTKLLDREKVDTYTLLIPIPDLLTFIPINITVLDVDDNPPYCGKRYEFTVTENHDYVIILGDIKDADSETIVSKSEITSMNDSRLHMSNSTLNVYRLDYEKQPRYDIEFLISSSGGTSKCYITLNVKDVNDNAPVFTPTSLKTVLLETASIGTQVETMKAHDADTNTTLYYEISDGNNEGVFDIDPATGQVYITMSLSTITNDKVTLTIKASDGSLEALGYINITIIRIYDIVQMTSLGKIPKDVKKDLKVIEKSLSLQTNASVKIVQIAGTPDGSGTVIDVYGIAEGRKIDILKAMDDWKVVSKAKIESPKTSRIVGSNEDRDALIGVIIVMACLLALVVLVGAYIWYQRRKSFRLPVGKEHTQLQLSQVATISMVQNTAEKERKI